MDTPRFGECSPAGSLSATLSSSGFLSRFTGRVIGATDRRRPGQREAAGKRGPGRTSGAPARNGEHRLPTPRPP